jgi:hypothetical protein
MTILLVDSKEFAEAATISLEAVGRGMHDCWVPVQRLPLAVYVKVKPGLLSKLGGTKPVKLLPSTNLLLRQRWGKDKLYHHATRIEEIDFIRDCIQLLTALWG